MIKMESPFLVYLYVWTLPAYSFIDMDIIMPICTTFLTHFLRCFVDYYS